MFWAELKDYETNNLHPNVHYVSQRHCFAKYGQQRITVQQLLKTCYLNIMSRQIHVVQLCYLDWTYKKIQYVQKVSDYIR